MQNIFAIVGLLLASISISQAQVGWVKAVEQPVTQLLVDVTMRDANDVVAVGDRGTIIYSSDGGVHWEAFVSGVNVTLSGVEFLDATSGMEGFVVGDRGTILHTTDYGTSWMSQGSGTTTSLYGIDFGDRQHGIIVGADQLILRTTDGGVSWRRVERTGQADFSKVVFVTNAMAYAIDEAGQAIRTTDFGATWSTAHAGTDIFMDISFADPANGMIVGLLGGVTITTDNGNTWTKKVIDGMPALSGVSYITREIATIVGFDGVIFRTTDGGDTWHRQSSGTTKSFTAVAFTSSNHGVAVGFDGTVLYTTDGGTTSVKEVYDPSSSPLLQQNFPNPARDITTFRFRVPRQGAVVLDIIDALGNIVAVVVNEAIPEGTYEATFDLTAIAVGAYFYRLQVAGQHVVMPLVVVR